MLTPPSDKIPRILLIEDDRKLAALTQEYLETHGFHIALLNSGHLATETIHTTQPDLVILDLMLPGKSGLDICREIRPTYSGAILMFTALDDDLDHLLGLELGADDYVIKPIQPRLLLARIHTLLRRVSKQPLTDAPPKIIHIGDLRINPLSREAHKAGQPLTMTTAEFDLLYILASHAGEIKSRDDILKSIRGIDYDGCDRSIDLRISRLRKKLGDDPIAPHWIKTVRGKGYLFTAEVP